MSDELLKQIGEKVETMIKASVEAQKANDEQEKRYAKDMETVQEASKASAKAAEEVQELKAKIDSVEKTADHVQKMVSRIPAGEGKSSEQNEMEQKAREQTHAYLRRGDMFTDDVSKYIVDEMCKSTFLGITESKKELEKKDLLAGSNVDGGYFIRPERSTMMIKRMFETSPVRQIANIQTTNSDTVEFIIDDDESTSGGWVGECESRPNTNTPTIGLLTIPIHEQYASPRSSQKMLDDAGFDVETWLSGKTTDRMNRTENTAFVIGDGAGKPKGFLSYPAWTTPDVYERGKIEQINSGVSANFSGDGLKQLQNSLKEVYQRNAVWGIKRKEWEKIIVLKDTQGQYIFQTRFLENRDRPVLLGKNVIFMEDMPSAAADSLSMVYGDFSVGYTIIDRLGFRVLRDPYLEKPKVIFYTTKRVGGDVTNYESIKIQKLAV